MVRKKLDFLTSELSKFNEIRESLTEGKAIALKYLILGGTRWPVSCEEIITLTWGPCTYDVRMEGGGGFKNCPILRTDRLREMQTRGRLYPGTCV